MKWRILPNGDLEIRVDEQEQIQLREDRANSADPDSTVLIPWESEAAMRAVLEPLICNTELGWVEPEWIGALTDAPILGTFGSAREVDTEACCQIAGRWPNTARALVWWGEPVEQAWWFEPYAVRSPLDDLADTGRCVFQRAELEYVNA